MYECRYGGKESVGSVQTESLGFLFLKQLNTEKKREGEEYYFWTGIIYVYIKKNYMRMLLALSLSLSFKYESVRRAKL